MIGKAKVRSWKHHPLLTGDGLACGGLSKVQAANELCRIHEENLHLLAGLTQEEILEEQTRIKGIIRYVCMLYHYTD